MACLECRRRRIRCDNAKPSCQHCTRLSKKCEYAVSDQRRGPKKKSVKQLEERLGKHVCCANVSNCLTLEATIEAQLSAATASVSSDGSPANDPNFSSGSLIPSNTPGSDSVDPSLLDETMNWSATDEADFNNTNVEFQLGMEGLEWPVSEETTFPPQSINPQPNQPDGGDSSFDPFPELHEVQELNRLFFENVYPSIPIVHPRKHVSTGVYAPQEQSPLCLRYAMWTLTGVRSSKFAHRTNGFYRNARMHLEHDEMQVRTERISFLQHRTSSGPSRVLTPTG